MKPSLGQNKKGKLLKILSMENYAPNESDIQRILDSQESNVGQESSWFNLVAKMLTKAPTQRY